MISRFDRAIHLSSRRPTWRILGVVLALVCAGCGKDSLVQTLPPSTVGPDGATLQFEQGAVRIEIPRGAVSANVTLAVTASEQVENGLVSKSYELGPIGTQFDVPVTVRIAIDDADLQGIALPQDLLAAVFADSLWQGIPGSRVDIENNEVMFELDGLDEPVLVQPGTLAFAKQRLRPSGTQGRAIAWLPNNRRGSRFGQLAPRYVNASTGNDANPGTESQPWRSINAAPTSNLSRLGFGDKMVIQGPYEYTEPSPIDLPPNVHIEGIGAPTLRNVQLRAGVTAHRAHVRNLNIEFDAPGSYAIEVSDGFAAFERISTRTTLGVRVTGGRPAILSCTLRDGANIEIEGGNPEIDGNTVRDGAVGIHIDGTTVTLRGNTLRNCVIGVSVPHRGHVILDNNTFRSNDVGVFVGHRAPFNDPVLDPPSSSAVIRSSSFVANTEAGLVIATTGNVAQLGNTWSSEPPTVWNGPEPWIGPVDIVYLFAPLGAPRWWELPGPGPSPRFGAAMGYDADTGLALLFGGRSGATNLDDTWTFDLSSLEWNLVATSTPPPARHDHAIAYGPNTSRRCLLFGGHTNAVPDVGFADLWVYDGVIEEWFELTPQGNPGDGRMPGPRYGAVFERVNEDHYFLYGGLAPGGAEYAEWWIYDAAANQWTDLTDHANLPPFRGYPASYGSGEIVWIYGGADGNGTPLDHFHSYVWGNGNQNRWETVTLSSASPPPLAYSILERTVPGNNGGIQHLMFGGTSAGEINGNTWILNESSSGGMFRWTWELWRARPGAETPPPRSRHASFSWDGTHGRTVLVFGGDPGAAGAPHGDTWLFMPGGN